MSVLAIAGRSLDGFILSVSQEKPVSEIKQSKMLFRNQHLLPKQISMECGDRVFHFQKGNLINVMLVTPFQYSSKEAFTRLSELHDGYLAAYSEGKINASARMIESGNERLRVLLNGDFDERNIVTTGYLPEQVHISTILDKIKSQPLGLSTPISTRRHTVSLSWKEIGLLVPLTLLAFFKTFYAIRTGGTINLISNFTSTCVAFYLVFVCVHGLLTPPRLLLPSFLLLVLLYGTTYHSLFCVVLNGTFALVTLANVASYYLRGSADSKSRV